MEEYLNVSELTVDEQIDDTQFKVYQIQEYHDDCCLMHVGNFSKLHDVLINNFNYNDKQFMIISCLYTEEQLLERSTIPIFQIKQIGSEDGQFISYNLQTEQPVKESDLSTFDSIFKIKGVFTTTYCNQIIDLHDKFKGKKAIDKMIKQVPNLFK